MQIPPARPAAAASAGALYVLGFAGQRQPPVSGRERLAGQERLILPAELEGQAVLDEYRLARAMHMGRQAAERARLAGAGRFMLCPSSAVDAALRLVGAKGGQGREALLLGLRSAGASELALMIGAYLACAHMGLFIVADERQGAVALAEQLCPGLRQWCLSPGQVAAA